MTSKQEWNRRETGLQGGSVQATKEVRAYTGAIVKASYIARRNGGLLAVVQLQGKSYECLWRTSRGQKVDEARVDEWIADWIENNPGKPREPHNE